ncbi:hypothetical protein RA11412_2374 [Rothia aeria]|uniref:Uncharacterized protein n=1 Tax=Rothia aeria TaxID=172042 RepID=A0A2Z5R1V5_9MICC|nr:hypothetical protein RA11412_2374 [Rothia aeria]
MSEQNHLRTEENPRIDKARILKDRLEKNTPKGMPRAAKAGGRRPVRVPSRS